MHASAKLQQVASDERVDRPHAAGCLAQRTEHAEAVEGGEHLASSAHRVGQRGHESGAVAMVALDNHLSGRGGEVGAAVG